MQESSNRTRRTFIKSAGVIGAAALAGCSGGSDIGTEYAPVAIVLDGESSDGATTGTGSETMADEIGTTTPRRWS